MIVPRLYEDLSVLHVNTMPVHNYFIPSSAAFRPSGGRPVREDSDRLTMLSGDGWLFRYFSSIHALTEPFCEEVFAEDEAWQREKVPFCWQMRGYDENQYTNIRYPFPFDPPFVPQHNPCGAYRRRFEWHKNPEAPRTYLHFEGVDSCFYAWLNGRYLGYSQVTHHTSEFDVTDFLREGENLLAVLVLKWCDGSYLEDQDKFRLSGIIRDVYLIDRPACHIEDYLITTELAEDFGSGDVCISFRFSDGDMPVKIRLADCLTGEVVAEAETEGEDVRLTVPAPRLWNAESPCLYALRMESENEIITDRVGFRTVCVRGGVVLLNGCPIKFRGVNRHESDPVTGSVVTWEQVEKDLAMIKAHNFNSVRASHYPDVPYFYQLCDAIGLYVIDEADNESHGTAPLYVEKDIHLLTMPRLGLRAFLDPALDRAEYFGVGPYESYADKHRAGHHGCFTSSVRDLHEDYIRPQENGSHWDCDYVKLSGGGLTLTAATGDGHAFSFNASVYTQEELESRRHNYELTPCGSTVLCLDHRMAGIGSKSCGPDLSPEYRVDAAVYSFAFVIKPEASD